MSTRASKSPAPALKLPPPFTLVTLREVGDAFAHATSVASELGAGALTYVGRFDLAEFAVVLEPDEPLRTARRAFYAGMTALTDALLAYAPPEKPVVIDWPGSIRIDGGLVGGGRLGWPKDTREDETPPWIVFGGMIRTVAMNENDIGLHPFASALEQEGFDDSSAEQLVESFARHLMVATDAWQSHGFAEVEKEYIGRLAREPGVSRRIDTNGDLLTRRTGKAGIERQELLPTLPSPSWFDPKTGGPRL